MFGVVPFLHRLLGRPLWTPVGLYAAPPAAPPFAPPATQDAARVPAPRLPDWSAPYQRPLSRL